MSNAAGSIAVSRSTSAVRRRAAAAARRVWKRMRMAGRGASSRAGNCVCFIKDGGRARMSAGPADKKRRVQGDSHGEEEVPAVRIPWHTVILSNL